MFCYCKYARKITIRGWLEKVKRKTFHLALFMTSLRLKICAYDVAQGGVGTGHSPAFLTNDEGHYFTSDSDMLAVTTVKQTTKQNSPRVKP